MDIGSGNREILYAYKSSNQKQVKLSLLDVKEPLKRRYKLISNIDEKAVDNSGNMTMTIILVMIKM